MESHRIDTGLVDLRTLLQQESSSRRHIQELLTCLPKITETELQDLGHSESVCPICFNTFLAILAEEEMALVMESPAHPVEELGVTRLQETCGHLFCRRDITKWIRDGRGSCPTCRRPFLTVDGSQRDTEQYSLPDGFLPPWIVDRSMVATESGNASLLPILAVPSAAMGSHSTSAHQRESRDDFSGMYS